MGKKYTYTIKMKGTHLTVIVGTKKSAEWHKRYYQRIGRKGVRITRRIRKS